MVRTAVGFLAAWAWSATAWCQAGAIIPLDQPGDALLCDKLDNCPHPVTVRGRIAKGQLAFTVETVPAAVVKADQPQSLLRRTGFAFVIDPFRNFTRYLVVTVDFDGKAVTHLVHQADYFEVLAANVASQLMLGTGDGATLPPPTVALFNVSVPLDRLGIVPAAGDEWGIRIIPHLLDAKGKPLESGGAMMWSKGVSLPRPQWLAKVLVGSNAAGYSLTRGNLAPEEVFALNRFAWTWLEPAGSGQGKVIVRSVDSRQRKHVEGSRGFAYTAGEPAAINVGYTCPADACAMAFEVQDASGKAVYASQYPVFPNMPSRLPSPKSHFNKGCLTRVVPDPRLEGDTRLVWHHNVRELHTGQNDARRWGYAYDAPAWWDTLKRTGQVMILVDHEMRGVFEGSDYVSRARASGVPVALMPRGKATLTVKGRDAIHFYGDPETRESYLASMRDQLRKNGDIIRYIYFGDEFRNSMVRDAIYLWRECRAQYPFIERVNDDIKTLYGFGKYGIPENSDWRFQFEYIEPYHWLALRRWASDVTVEMARQAKDEARKINPNILMISPDPKCGNQPENYELWRGLFDVATHQVYLKPVPEEQMFPGFNVKLIRDLAGIPHVWPCLHLELGAHHLPEEVREVLSQVFIAGGDGLHDWPIPMYAMDGPYVNRLSAPANESMFQQFSALVNAGLRPKHDPGKTVALLYCNDSCAAQGDEYGIPQPPRAYQYLSDGCAVNFRFVGDLGLERGDDRAEDYKVMVVPVAGIIRRGVTEKILAAVKAGLRLLVLQPDAFSFHLDGSSTEELACAMRGGASLVEHRQASGGALAAEPGAQALERLAVQQLPFVGEDYKYRFTDLTPYKRAYTFADLPKEAAVILRYPDGAAAGIECPVGKGRVCWLGVSPLIVNYSKEWVAFHRALLAYWGIALDQPVWRLLLPLKFERTACDWLYLTGNGYAFECSVPQATMNVYLPGTYQYDVRPDRAKDVRDDGGPIPFAEGRLTDRPTTTAGQGLRYVTYGSTGPITVDFDLCAAQRVDRVDVYAADYAPRAELSAGMDGKVYRLVAQAAETGDVSGVKQIPLAPARSAKPARFWRLSFGPRPEKKTFTIVEVDFLQRAAPAAR